MIDVIIPVYNTPLKDLERCFKSINNQSYNSWKVIIVDDGSNDEIKTWLDNYCKLNKKFNVFHINNSGVSYARNYGISKSQGEYITFCDSDDEFTSSFFEEAISMINNNKADLIIGGTEFIYTDKKEKHASLSEIISYNSGNINELYSYMLSGKKKNKDDIIGNCLSARIYPKLYKRNLLNDVSFDTELKMHEDNFFSYLILEKCNKVCVTNKIWYLYYQNDYSITHKKYSDELLNQELLFCRKMMNHKNEINDLKIIDGYKIKMLYSIENYLQMLRYCRKEKYKSIKNLTKEEFINTIDTINFSNYYDVSFKHKIILKILNIKCFIIKNSCLYLIVLGMSLKK